MFFWTLFFSVFVVNFCLGSFGLGGKNKFLLPAGRFMNAVFLRSSLGKRWLTRGKTRLLKWIWVKKMPTPFWSNFPFTNRVFRYPVFLTHSQVKCLVLF